MISRIIPCGIALALANAAHGAPADWNQAFSLSDEKEPEVAIKADDLGIEDGSAELQDDSFPVALGKAGVWGEAPAAPEALKKRYRIAGCAFTVETTSYAVNTYTVAGVGEYEMAQSAVRPRSILEADASGDLFVSVSAGLTLTMDDELAPVCRKKLAKARELPRPTLSGKVAAEGGGGKAAPREVRAPESDRVFVRWDQRSNALVLENEEGLEPSAESALVKFDGQQIAGRFLAFQPAWRFVRD